MIKCLTRDRIDQAKWDQCVRNAHNGRLYAISYYLDLVCNKGGWQGLIYGDYEAVMPLPLNNKVPLFTRIANPIFTQQLGIFSPKTIDAQLLTRFISAIPESFRSVYLQFNDANSIPDSIHSNIEYRSNFTLALDKPYEELYSAFSKNIKRNINTAEKHKLSISEVDMLAFNAFYLKHSKKETVKKTQLDSFLPALVKNIIDRNHGKIWGVKDEDGAILAACLLTDFNGRLTYLLARSSAEGKSKSAMHFIIKEIIKAQANKSTLLDFEGSEIKSVARFFQSFGSIDTPYPVLSYARFPFKKTIVQTNL